MSKANGFINIPRVIWRSPEVLALSLPAKVVLTELHYCFTGKNNGQLRLPYAVLIDLHRLSTRTITRAIRELKDAGLIETTVNGSFDHKEGTRRGCCNQYRLTRPPRSTK